MKIDSIELYLVENEFKTPWHTAYGCDDGNCALFTRMRSGDKEGWSESSPLGSPNYSAEYGEGVFQVARQFFAPVLVGREIGSAGELNDLLAPFKSNPFAKGGLEMAWWTLQAEMKGVSLGTLLGKEQEAVTIGEAEGIYEKLDDLIAAIGRDFDKGYTRMKLKMCHGWDYDMLCAVRSVFPTQVFHVDANSSYRFQDEDDVKLLKSLDKFHLAMIEQPFNAGDIYFHAKLQNQMETPICLDETITEPWQAEAAAELNACRYINIKPARVGGLQNTLDINRICRQAGIGCWIGGMLEGDVGKGICVEAAALGNMTYPHDISPGSSTYVEDVAAEKLVLNEDKTFSTAKNIGTPIKPDMEKLLKKTTAKAVLYADGAVEYTPKKSR